MRSVLAIGSNSKKRVQKILLKNIYHVSAVFQIMDKVSVLDISGDFFSTYYDVKEMYN